MSTIFTKIINKEIPGHFLYEDDICIAILDIFPTVKGQSLVIPKIETDYAFDLDDATYAHIFIVAKKLGRVLDAVLNTTRTCMVVEGFDVPHMHIKMYPLTEADKPLGAKIALGKEADHEKLASLATDIRAAMKM